jgi:hypothetical protein
VSVNAYPEGYQDPGWDGTERDFAATVLPARARAIAESLGAGLPDGMRLEWRGLPSAPARQESTEEIMNDVTQDGEVRVLCLLLVGEHAELVVEDGDPEDVVRHPAADVAAQVGIPAAELPGKVLLVRVDGESEGDRRLSGFRLAD